MTTPLRWGILGVALINDRLIPAFRSARTANLRAIASRTPERAAEAAQRAGIPVAHGSYEALLADPDIDAVYIPLPNTLHAHWTRQAAAAGKHILCEKPLCPTAREAADLVAECRTRGVRLMDGFMWPHHPRTARLRQLLDHGTIGTIRHVVGAFTFPLTPYTPENIRLQPEMAGGSLLDVGCYPVFGIRWAFAAEPVRVMATATYDHGVDVALSGSLAFADGGTASFDCGFRAPLRQWLEIVGTDGVLRIPKMWLPDEHAAYEVYDRDGRLREEGTVAGHDQIACMLDDFGEAVAAGREPTPSPDEATKTLRVLEALARSARDGQAVSVG
jgi:predicted dehydrogenase